ncbi:hypothetical protein M9H77_36372 [Catharanthus roseus]|uniref:Uncharacterized protein n=1 Tax=Catharanthus roseus TaxID=4058 RepID=A0ACB9ZTU0_CATRO|nr:hypothetical protein M9H77_36372 [Catharanthus roseus]
MCYQLIVSTPIDVSKIAKVKYPDSDIYVENVILSGDLIALSFEGYGVILGMGGGLKITLKILVPDLYSVESVLAAGQMALQFVNTYENLILPRTSHHALRWDGRLVEIQKGLETEVGPLADLVGTPGVCSLF